MLRFSGLACCGLALVAARGAPAQEAVQETKTVVKPNGAVKQTRKISRIMGSTVRLQGNNNFGKVEDVVLDENGGIDYVVVAHDGRYAMLPWGPADVNYGDRVVTYDVAPKAVQPFLFAGEQWPDVAAENWTNQVRDVFGPRAIRRQAARPVLNAPPPGAPGAAPAGSEKVKIKEKPNGDVKVKVKERD